MRQDMKPEKVWLNPGGSVWSSWTWSEWRNGKWNLYPIDHPHTTEYVRGDMYDKALSVIEEQSEVIVKATELIDKLLAELAKKERS